MTIWRVWTDREAQSWPICWEFLIKGKYISLPAWTDKLSLEHVVF